MTTASGTTTWCYHPQRGKLTAKIDAAEESTTHTPAGRREERQQAGGDYWEFEYDTFNQLDSAVKKNDTSVTLPGYAWDFDFDAIGNRSSVTTNGQTSTYTVNDLNQFTARAIPRVMQFQGQVHPDAVLTFSENDPVPGVAMDLQRLTGDSHWLAEADYSQAADPNDPQYGEFTLEGTLAEAGHNSTDAIAEAEVTKRLKAHPENCQYDLDGNLLSDGLWDYEWDGENRLIAMENRVALATFFAANNLKRKRVEFVYNSQSRRIQKDTFEWDGQGWLLVESRRWLYDNWNPLVELRSTDGQSYGVVRTYLWGLDLAEQAGGYRAGSPVGAQAGGVGGLLAITSAGNLKTLLPFCDGHGNVMCLIDADSAEIVAEYEYSPFGETLRATGPMADRNPFRFSTKYTDNETGLLYYGFRYYASETGRWLNRDPIEEQGGLNLYGFVGNDPANNADYLGKIKIEIRFNPVRGGQEFLGKVRYHAYVVITKCEVDTSNPSGFKTLYVRGGPSDDGRGGIGDLVSPGGSFGEIVMDYGDYLPGTVDWATDAVSIKVFEDATLNAFDETKIVIDAFTSANSINSIGATYKPLGPNSNSAAYQVIENLGYGRPSPPVSAPGWDMDISNPPPSKPGPPTPPNRPSPR